MRRARKRSHRWQMCPMCGLMLYAEDLSHHTCHEKVRAKVDAELDILTVELMANFDKQEKKFWRAKDVKFVQWLLKNDRY